MARKSRKNIVETTVIAVEKVYNAAIYARLSGEDKRAIRESRESDSLENQIYLIKQFAEKRPFLNVCGVYSDFCETGTNFDRPGFTEMMDEVKAGQINCIIVKDLSRFGRNYIETGNFLEKIFPYLGVRFISINDNYDTANPYNNSETLAIALKSLIHDIYAKDISRKVSAAIEIKQKKGEFIGSRAPYGYIKSPDNKHKLIIDEEAAVIVRNIFKWKLEGIGYKQIILNLTDLGIAPPNKYSYLKGFSKNRKYAEQTLWVIPTIISILKNPVYIGCLARGKIKTRLSQGLSPRKTSPDEWIIIHDTHEPIINKAIFDKVQVRLKGINREYHEKLGKSKYYTNPENIFLRLIRCVDCGKNLIRKKTDNGNGEIFYTYCCPTHTSYSERVCTKKSIGEKILMKSVFGHIQNEIKLFIRTEDIVKKLQNSKREKSRVKTLKEQIAELKRDIQKKSNRLDALYGDYADEILSKDEYLFAKAKYTEELRLFKLKLDELTEQERLYSKSFISDNKWINALSKWQSESQLSHKMLTELVDHIEISEYNKIEVFFKHKDGYAKLQELITERGVNNGN
jgi:DNA invertase Pin-like site-specific DNA recombinase